ncbi:MAG: NAD(P)H-hydrate dehydratase, partial [Firmicutes bacterium]|nr:NAD(P)H-hydrate dehydratase [Bacillota bacterium]
VAARYLARAGVKVELFLLARDERYSGDAAVNLKILRHMGFPLRHILEEGDLEGFRTAIARTGLVIDALLGTGTRGEPRGLYAPVIEEINQAQAPVFAVDIPSGVDANSGAVHGVSIKAQRTVTFALPKRGLYLFPGAACVGELKIVDIGIPRQLTADSSITENLITAQMVRDNLPARPLNSHKGSFGRALIIAGSPGMSGAAALAARAALQGGAGLVYAATAASLRPVLEAKLVEAIALGLPETEGGGLISSRAVPQILDFLQNCSALAVGPGLPPGKETLALLQELLPSCPVPVVVDAGALAALAAQTLLLRQACFTPVVTPHPGEMAALCQSTSKAVQQNRIALAAEKAEEWKAVVVLKGAYTVIALPTGEIYINPIATPALATAGTGDLLTGLIAAQLSQGLEPSLAAICSTYIHGLAGLLAAEKGERGITAAQIADYIPRAFSKVESS